MYLYNVGFDMVFGEEGLYVRTADTNILNMQCIKKKCYKKFKIQLQYNFQLDFK